MNRIPPALHKRVPLIKPEYLPLLERMLEHPHAPLWNTQCGDRLTATDVSWVNSFKKKLHHRESRGIEPPESILEWLKKVRPYSALFRERLTAGFSSFSEITPMTREDMVMRLADIVPENANLDRLLVNPTSGTTGHPIQAPNHPRAIGCYNPMIMFALGAHGVVPPLHKDMVACILICAQQDTIMYATVKPMLNGAGFAKINLAPHCWKTPESPLIYLNQMKPYFLTGDPFSFSRLLREIPDYRPAALMSTSLGLSPQLRQRLEKNYECPVIDFYSLNETGPIAYSCPKEPQAFHLLPTDLHLEVIDQQGRALPEGEIGEITVTGGRNPYLPLLRYRTGDFGRLSYAPCPCGDPMPRILHMSSRELVIYYTPNGHEVNPIDVNRLMKPLPIIQHEFFQHEDLSCTLQLRLLYGTALPNEDQLREGFKRLFGPELHLRIVYKE